MVQFPILIPIPSLYPVIIHETHADSFDCDDFAFECYRDVRGAFRGNGVLAFGICNVPGHMLNFMITKQGIYLYDYRLDRIWKAMGADSPYFWLI